MTELVVKLDAESIHAATAQTVMGLLTPEAREQMLTAAITALLREGRNSYDKRTPIETAFQYAVEQLAHDVCRDLVKSDPAVTERLAQLARAAADKILNIDADKMADKMADAFCASMRGD